MTTSDKLITVLSENSADFSLYLVTADLLEEEGKWELARAYRWCGENEKRPHQDTDENRTWMWLITWENPIWNSREDKYARLPYGIRDGYEWFQNHMYYHPSFASVMQALANHFDVVVNRTITLPV